MAVKKTGKSVLDYDPLSWLKGDEADADTDQPSGEPLAQQAAEEEAADKPASSEAQKAIEESASENLESIKTAASAEQPEAAADSSKQEQLAVADTANDYLVLDSELTMKNVAEFKLQLDEIMKADTPVSIDAAALRKIDSAGLQMLYSLQKTLKKNGASINWKQESDVIKTAADIIEMDFVAVPDQKSIAEIEAEQGFGFF